MSGSNNTSTAATVEDVLVWNVAAVLSVAVTIAAILTNGFVLLVLLSYRVLWTPFSVYIISLLTANLFYHVVNGPLDAVNDLYASWWLGSSYCTLYQYAQWVINGTQVYSHVVIAFNRLWAIVFPVSYKNYHGFAIAFPACLGAWICAHVINLPILILDHLYYRLPEETNGCLVDTTKNFGQKVGGLITEFITVTVVCIIFAQYPFVWWKHLRRRKWRTVKPVTESVALQFVRKELSATVTTEVTPANVTGRAKPERAGVRPTDYNHKRRAFILLSVMTLSILIFWTPSIVYYSMLEFQDVYQPEIYTSVTVLFEFQSAIDPLMFVSSLKELRSAVRKVMHKIVVTFRL